MSPPFSPAGSFLHPASRHTATGCAVGSLSSINRMLGFCSAINSSVVRRREALQLLQALHGLQCLEGVVVDARGVQAAALLEGVFRQGGEELLEFLLHR